MRKLNEPPCYLAYTDGWGDEPIVKCDLIAKSTNNPRLVICVAALPTVTRTFVVYDRFSQGSWLPLNGSAEVGVLIGDVDPDRDPDAAELELQSWATLFSDYTAAEAARARLRPINPN